MSDQTDIERIVEKWLSKLDLRTHDRLTSALTEYAQLRDEETARLKEESKRRLDGWTQAEQDLKETADQLRARLAEAEVVSERRQKLAEGFAAEQLALEAQCQRMRDALTNIRGWVIANTKTPAHNVLRFTGDALSAPLDLELLNRVRDEIQGQIRVDGHNRGCSYDMMSFDHQSDRCNCGQTLSKLLKSLSPAEPNAAALSSQ